MQDSTSKEKVLKNIRKALINSMPSPYPAEENKIQALKPLEDEENLDISFAMAFKDVNGQFVYVNEINELLEGIHTIINNKGFETIYCEISEINNYLTQKGVNVVSDKKDIPNSDVVISDCECLIARYGSIVLSSKQPLGRKSIAGPENHIILARNNQIVKDISQAFDYLKSKYDNVLPSMFTFVTGPSRTADIEKTLVMGAHGQKELFLFLFE